MLRSLSFTLVFLCSLQLNAENNSAIRDLFYRASKSPASADSLFEKYKNSGDKDAFNLAYKAMSQLMICFHSYNPYTKLKYFIRGKETLEAAIKADPKNIEFRFLRLCTQLNTPSFLGYSSNIEEDKLAIFNGVKTARDQDLLVRISNYTTTAKRLTAEEKFKVRQALNNNKYFFI